MTQPDQARRIPRYSPFVNLVLARVREFGREPAAIFWVYVFPLILVVALGAAFRSRPVDHLRVAVVEGSRAAAIRAALDADSRFEAAIYPDDQARLRLRTARADLMVEAVPASDPPRSSADGPEDPGAMSEDVQPRAAQPQPAPNPGGYRYSFDPAQPTSVLAREAADRVLQRMAGQRQVVPVQDRPVDETGGRYIDFLVPGLLGLGLLGGGLWGVGFAIVDMRIRKLLKRYLATPMRRSHFLAAVMASRLLFTIPEVLLVLVFARLMFGVTSQGSYLAVALLILLGAFQFAGIGLLVASRAQTIETVSGLMNAVMLPMWIGSGLFFSIDRFPAMVQPLLQLLPLTPLIAALRSVMLEGAGLLSLGPELALIVLWGAVPFAIALRIFRWN